MDKRILWIIIMCIVILFCLVTFVCNEKVYNFPLNKTDMESFVNTDLPLWKIVQYDSFYDNHLVYLLKHRDEVYCAVNMTRTNADKRLFSIMTHFTSESLNETNTRIIEDFNKNDLNKFFNFTQKVYGGNTDIAFREFNDFMKNSITKGKDGVILWVKRLGNEHYDIRMSKRGDEYEFVSLSIRNNDSYENYMCSLIDGLSCTYYKIDEIKDKNVKHDIEKNMDFIVKGKINNLRKADELPEFLISDTTLYSGTENYLCGELTDDTGSMTVYMLPTSLTFKELGETRAHYISVYGLKQIIYVVQTSAKVK